MFANSSVCRPLNVNGRTMLPNGPISFTIVRVFASTTDIVRVLPSASKYTNRPSSEILRVVRIAGLVDRGDWRAGRGVRDDPFRRAEHRRVQRLPSGDSAMRSVPRAIVTLFPDQLVGEQVVRGDAPAGRHIEPGRLGVRGDALDRLLSRARPPRPLAAAGGRRRRPLQRDALDELVAVIDVEDEDAGAAVIEVVAAADARQCRVQKTLSLLGLRMRGDDRGRKHGCCSSHECANPHRDISSTVKQETHVRPAEGVPVLQCTTSESPISSIHSMCGISILRTFSMTDPRATSVAAVDVCLLQLPAGLSQHAEHARPIESLTLTMVAEAHVVYTFPFYFLPPLVSS